MPRNDMADALAAWQGAPVEAARRAELLARLRADGDFRKEFAEAVWTLSMVRVVQAPEPRWLGVSEELGLCGDDEGASGDAAEQAIMAEVRRKTHRLQVSRRWRTMAMVSAGLAAVLMVFLFIASQRDAGPKAVASAPQDERKLAVLSGESSAVWEREPVLAGGNWLRPGAHRLLAGSETLVFSDGVRVRLQAPVDFSLVDEATICCRRGALRVTLADGSDGFRVEVPFGSVTDRGTDFAVLVGPDDGTRVAVFEGKVEIAIRQRDSDGIRLVSMAGGETMQITADGSTWPAEATGMPPPPDTVLPPMGLPEAYVERILAGKPQHYWRLNRMENGKVPDETGNGNPLVPVGRVEVSTDAGGRSSLRLTGDGGLESSAPWRLRREGAALELWFASEGKIQTTLAGLATSKADARHFAMLGHSNYDTSEGHPGRPMTNTLRYLTRWPIGIGGGVNLFSEPVHGPLSWHHVVIQLKHGRMELHADGMPVKIAKADPMPETIDLFLTFGFAYTKGDSGKEKIQPDRFLNGRMAEIAVYDRVLSLEEIRERCGRMAEIAAYDKNPGPEKNTKDSGKTTE